MPLAQLWDKTPDTVLKLNIKQVVSAAGDGTLADSSECSKELRYYLKDIPEEKLFEHIKYCLESAFEKSGYVLQDLVNEIGRRLDYLVENGLYQGRTNQIGFDGIWEAPDGHAIIVEIKTSDAYRINLDSVAAYRNKLVDAQRITKKSSILIVVGRQDTGDLEAQIRGSRHAWDTRIISIDALIKLLELKIKSDEDQTTEKIRNLLVPFEYTRLDNIIDVVFTTAKDVESANQEAELTAADSEMLDKAIDNKQEHTPRVILDKVREDALRVLSKREGTALIAHKRAQYWSSDKSVRAVCPVSKKYERGQYYWYAFHPPQNVFLKDCERGYLLLGCVDRPIAYALPYEFISRILPYLNTTEKESGAYWHIHLWPNESGEMFLLMPKKGDKISVKNYELKF